MGSTRLPGKIMLPLIGKPVLYRVIERILDSRTVDKIIIATTIKPNNDCVVSVAKEMKVDYYRGSEEDVLSRYYESATKFKLDIVIRITSDCPLIDPDIIDEMVKKFKKINMKNRRCDYLSNVIKRTFPRGLDVEIFWYDVLKRVYNEAKESYQREHVTPYIYENPKIFNLRNFEQTIDYSHYRWTLDEGDDYSLISKIYKKLYYSNPKFRYKDIISLLEKKPELISINAHVRQKEAKIKK